jgi:hypothetical protein
MKLINFMMLVVFFASCRKQTEWLDIKSSKADITPSTWGDFQALLDNDQVMNTGYPSLGVLGADNYYLTTATWQSNDATARNAYIWAADIYEGQASGSWTRCYRMIEQANIVLAGVQEIEQEAAISVKNNVVGSALFFRGYAYYMLLQEFAKPYNASTAATDAGIVLKQTDDVNETISRASVAACYQQVIDDLGASWRLLPIEARAKTRPSKAAAAAALAKVNLVMGNYALAGMYADSALALHSTLMNFNTLSTTATRPFPTFQNDHPEVFFYALSGTYGSMLGTGFIADSSLYRSYAANDLRKAVFYRVNANGTIGFKGTYTGTTTFFSGLATNEMYLIKAEAEARVGNMLTAMDALNALLLTRWKAGTYVPMVASSANEALQKILAERRKELPFTGNTRWEDLRRLNMDPQFAVTLTRSVGTDIYFLPPQSPRYVYPIPDEEIRASGIEQNAR